MNLNEIDHRLDEKAGCCRMVVETSKGRRAKLSYDAESGGFELKHFLPDGMSFPMDFGFVPSTRGEDGDPLDIMLLADEPLPAGTIARVRLIGVIEGEQTEKVGKTVRNDRILAVADGSHLFSHVSSIGDLGDDFMKNVTRFWVNFNALHGREFKVVGVRDAARVVGLIRAGVAGLKNKLQAAMAAITPESVKAEQHRKMAEPGTGDASQQG
jgi:inorganic pyrophosphatase